MLSDKRLIRKANIVTCKDPEFFNLALNVANSLFELGYNWDSIKNILITRVNPYTFFHPDLNLVHTQLNRIHGRSIV